MSKATKLDFTTIENSYNDNLDRSEGEDVSITDNTGLFRTGSTRDDGDNEVSKKVSGQDLDNLWIRSWIKSRNFKPKVSGFKLDGKTGKIECTGLDVWGGTITGATFQTGTSGERIVISEDNIVAFDVNGKLRMATDSGQWMFWDSNEVASGGFYATGTGSMLFASYNNLGLNANDGAGTINVVGNLISNTDALYDLGTRPDKWGDIYVQDHIRFDYTSINHISVITDSDSAYYRIRFDASSGNIGFGRSIYPISDTSYNLGVTSASRWNNLYLTGHVEFETTADAGFKWDAGGDNAQFFYYNDGNYFILTKPLSANSEKIINVADPTANQEAATKKYVDDNIPAAGANTALSNLASVAINTALLPAASYSLGSAGSKWNNLYMTGSIVVGGTVDGVNVSTYASAYNTHVASANSHHAQSHSHGSHSGIGANDHHAQSHSHGSHSGIGASDHHSSTSTGIAITPSSISTSGGAHFHGGTTDGNFTPSSSNTRHCGTSGAYWARVYSDAYFTKNATFQMFDKYDDLQILRNLKFGKKNELLIENLPKEIQEEGFINFGGMTSFNLCASKKIVECIDDLKKTIDSLTIRLNKLEKI
jgi:hypothetical protein